VLYGNDEELAEQLEKAKLKVWAVLISLYNIENPRIIAAQEMDHIACDNFRAKMAKEEKVKSFKRCRTAF